ncbi:hypothetical protein KBI23_19260 [bacterium]|nr:hypothetical protein [bacterium]MBP9810877.1 hypothetical protein [bacterium]
MSTFEAGNFTDKSSDNVTRGVQSTDSLHRQLSDEDFKKHLPIRIKPDVCIRDQDGFIACGPIVGIERPEPPIFKPRFGQPNDIEKFPSKLMQELSPKDIVPRKGF